jgi:hypothetical protein
MIFFDHRGFLGMCFAQENVPSPQARDQTGDKREPLGYENGRAE